MEPVSTPQDTDKLFVVLDGKVNLVYEKAYYHKILKDVRRLRKWRLKKHGFFVRPPDDFVSDFPVEDTKSMHIVKVGNLQTFGMDKLITNKPAKSAFSIAEGI